MPRKLLIVDESSAAMSMRSVKDKKKKRVLQIDNEDFFAIRSSGGWQRSDGDPFTRREIMDMELLKMGINQMHFIQEKIKELQKKTDNPEKEKTYEEMSKRLDIFTVTMPAKLKKITNTTIFRRKLLSGRFYGDDIYMERVQAGRLPYDTLVSMDELEEKLDRGSMRDGFVSFERRFESIDWLLNTKPFYERVYKLQTGGTIGDVNRPDSGVESYPGSFTGLRKINVQYGEEVKYYFDEFVRWANNGELGYGDGLGLGRVERPLARHGYYQQTR